MNFLPYSQYFLKNISLHPLSPNFLSIKESEPKKKNDKLDLITIKIFLMTDNTRRIKREAKDWERMIAKDISDKGQLSKIYKEYLKLSNKKTNSRNVK